MLNELRYTWRSLRKSPGFAAAAVVTLALGIGANTAIFSALEGIVLSPPGYRDPGRLTMVMLDNRALKHVTYASYPDFLDWQRASRSFARMAAFTPRGFDVTHPGTAEHVAGEEVSAGFFETLGVGLARGHDFSPDEDRFGGQPAVILSDRLWRRRLGGNPAAIGGALTMNGVDYTIAGVLPRDFRFGDEDADVYTLIGQGDTQQRTSRIVHNIGCVARFQTGVDARQAQAEMNAVQEHIAQENPATERGQGISLMTLQEFFVGDVSGVLMLLAGAVGLVLLIACANVANLLLARSAARRREIAVRLALGAGRVHIARQLVTESLMLSLTGGMAGLALAKWGLDAVLALTPGVPRAENIGLNIPVVLFALALSLAVGIAFGLLPAMSDLSGHLPDSLKDGTRGPARQRRIERALAVLEIAMALVLLVGASLLVRTIRNLWEANPGFDPRRVIAFKIGLSPSLTATPEKTRIAFAQLTERIRQLPGVAADDVTALLPLSQRDNSGGFWVGSRTDGSVAELPRATYYWTGPDYLRVMGIPLLRGRYIAASDTADSEHVIVIDSTLAKRYFVDTDPVGQTLTIPNWGPARIVGVVGHVNQWRMGADPYTRYQTYGSFYQLTDAWIPVFRQDLWITMRTGLSEGELMPQIKSVVYGAAPDQPVYDVRTMTALVSGSMTGQRFPMILLSVFAGLALMLACVGIYGVLSYATARRTREVGIRMALGAMRRDVLRMVLGDGLKLALIGAALGATAGLALTRVLARFSQLLYGVGASDPWTFMGVSVVLIAAALMACYIPARRAARLDPAVALRQE